MTQDRLMEILKNALNVKSISMDDSIETLEEWDSLSQLEILVSIDKESGGKAAKIRELAIALSVKKLIDVLERNGLISE